MGDLGGRYVLSLKSLRGDTGLLGGGVRRRSLLRSRSLKLPLVSLSRTRFLSLSLSSRGLRERRRYSDRKGLSGRGAPAGL